MALDTHGMDPGKVNKLSRALGARPTRTLVVGRERQEIVGREDYDMLMVLGESVCAAVEESTKLVVPLVEELDKEARS